MQFFMENLKMKEKRQENFRPSGVGIQTHIFMEGRLTRSNQASKRNRTL